MINRATTQRNYRRLVEYDESQNMGCEKEQGARKLTVNIDVSYHDVIKRLSLVEGISKTEVIRRAIDAYSEVFGDEVLFPSSCIEYFSDVGI